MNPLGAERPLGDHLGENMGRPVGSVNKAKVSPEVSETKVVFQETEVKKEPRCKEFICDHGKSMHYGPKTDWCNTQGCPCQTFRS